MKKKWDRNRTANASVFARLTSEERRLIERAIEKQLSDAGIPEAKLTIGKFMVSAAVERAKEILGEK